MSPSPRPRSAPRRSSRALALVALTTLAAGCGHRPAPHATARNSRTISGLYWGRLAEVPDGMRVQVWLESDGERVRGAYTALPWNADIEGHTAGPDAVALTLLERGISRAVGSRTRHVTLRWERSGAVLAGRDEDGGRVELVRAGFAPATLRPGVWLARWTGLPFGMAVETRLTRDPDGHFRAVYQYQGGGGTRDGSFDGELDAQGVLSLSWTELAEGGSVARGRARLAPSVFGLRGSYGIDGSNEGTGEWTLEPLGL
jgi:hypothetical protein